MTSGLMCRRLLFTKSFVTASDTSNERLPSTENYHLRIRCGFERDEEGNGLRSISKIH